MINMFVAAFISGYIFKAEIVTMRITTHSDAQKTHSGTNYTKLHALAFEIVA